MTLPSSWSIAGHINDIIETGLLWGGFTSFTWEQLFVLVLIHIGLSLMEYVTLQVSSPKTKKTTTYFPLNPMVSSHAESFRFMCPSFEILASQSSAAALIQWCSEFHLWCSKQYKHIRKTQKLAFSETMSLFLKIIHRSHCKEFLFELLCCI